MEKLLVTLIKTIFLIIVNFGLCLLAKISKKQMAIGLFYGKCELERCISKSFQSIYNQMITSEYQKFLTKKTTLIAYEKSQNHDV